MGLRLGVMDMRLIYKEAVEICQRAGVDPRAAGLTDSTVRLEQQLTAASSHYTYPVTPNQNGVPATATEQRLNQTDSFITYGLNFFIAEPSSAADVTYIDYTYPSPTVFVGAGEAAALATLWKGYLRVTVNNIVKIPTLHMGRFWFVPNAQKATAAANQNGIAQDERDGSTDGGTLLTGLLTLIGSKNNVIELFIPGALVVAANTKSIWEFRGLLAQNSTILA